MTFSLLYKDKSSDTFAGAAATGSLCVGGWVLRGHPHGGLTASQGAEPSVVWGEIVLNQLQKGFSAIEAIKQVTSADPRREWRQIAAIDRNGQTFAFSGSQNGAIVDEIVEDGIILTGNILSNENVLDRMHSSFTNSKSSIEDKLVAALRAGTEAGGDCRGLMSAALLVLSPDAPPLTLRVDFDEMPIDRLEFLLQKTREPGYSTWLKSLPTHQNPFALNLSKNTE